MHTLRCFGRVGVEGPGGDPVHLRSRKHLALLVYLVLNPDRDHPRERLASLFWESEPAQARHSLSQAIYDIRSNLPRARFDATVNHVALEAGSVTSEARRFEEAVRAGDAAKAVDLYSGAFAPDLEGVSTTDFERWVEDERNRLQRLAEMAFCRYVAECDDRARWGEMCTVALRLLDMNPLNEEAHRAFMRGMWLQGDQHGALEHFRKVEPLLDDELPEGVSGETRRVVERIRSSRPDLGRPEPQRPERPRLVGRRREFSRLKEALAGLEDGQGGVLVLRGEPGIGKTRLLEEIRELARLKGVFTLESRCFAAESDVAYGPLVEGLLPVARENARENGSAPTYHQLGVLFPDHFPDPGPARRNELEADAGRRRLYEETSLLLGRACDRTPRLWIVEDLHWMDGSSAALLHYVSRRLAGRPLLVLVSVRADEELEEATESLLDDWDGQGRAEFLEIEGLSDDEVSDLVRQVRPDLSEAMAETIRRLAGGNPFFALEMVSAAGELEEWGSTQRTSRDLLTRSLRSLIGVRLKGLDLEAVRLLETIAILERHALPFLVARTTNLSTGRVAEIGRTLYSRGLLHDDDGRLEFPHDITREYVYSNMGELQRAALHLVAGEVLAGSQESVSASTLARHFALGGDRPRAYEYAMQAAEQSALSYAHGEAVDLASLAAKQAGSPSERAAALEILAHAEASAGSVGSAVEHMTEAVETGSYSVCDTVELRLSVARFYTELGEVERLDSTVAKIEEALPRLGAETGVQFRLEALQWQLKCALRTGSYHTSKELRDQIQSEYRATPTASLTARSQVAALYSLAAYACFHESAEKTVSLLTELRELVPELPAGMDLSLAALQTAALLRLARWDEAHHHLLSTLEAARAKNDVLLTQRILNNLLVCAIEQGDWTRGEDLDRQLSQVAIGLSPEAATFLDHRINEADLLFYQGDARRAQDVLRGVVSRLQETSSSDFADAASSLGLVNLQLGDFEEAQDLWMQLQGISADHLRAVQDRYKPAWFSAFMRFVETSSLAESRGLLSVAESYEESVNIPSLLKLRWVGCLLSAVAEGRSYDVGNLRTTEEAQGLRAARMGWFVYFGARWFKTVLRRVPSRM